MKISSTDTDCAPGSCRCDMITKWREQTTLGGWNKMWRGQLTFRGTPSIKIVDVSQQGSERLGITARKSNSSTIFIHFMHYILCYLKTIATSHVGYWTRTVRAVAYYTQQPKDPCRYPGVVQNGGSILGQEAIFFLKKS